MCTSQDIWLNPVMEVSTGHISRGHEVGELTIPAGQPCTLMHTPHSVRRSEMPVQGTVVPVRNWGRSSWCPQL